MGLILSMLLGGVCFLALVGRRNEAETRERWEMILTAQHETVLAETAARLRHEQGMAGDSYASAEAARAVGALDEAARLLRVGARVVESCADTLPALLRSLRLLSRQAAAIAVSTPVEPRAFRAPSLRGAAVAAALIHHLLSTTRERLALRLRLLLTAVPAVTRWLIRASHRAAAAPQQPSAWSSIDDARHDLGALTDESLASLHLVLQSLSALPARRAVPAAKPVGRG